MSIPLSVGRTVYTPGVSGERRRDVLPGRGLVPVVILFQDVAGTLGGPPPSRGPARPALIQRPLPSFL
jgi:hypothetical protein